MNDPIGEIPILITGDYSDLNDAIKQSESIAQAGAQTISSAYTAAASGGMAKLDETIKLLTQDGVEFDASVKNSTSSVSSFGDVAAQVARQVSSTGDAASSAAGPISDVGTASSDAAAGASDATSGLKSMADQLLAVGEALAVTEALREFGQEALTAYDSVQRATNSLTALTGGAQQAQQVLEAIRTIAATQPFSFPELAQSAQKLAAFGISAEQIPQILQDAADVSRATGNSFDAIVAALGRVDLQGAVTGRQLVQLGLSWDDLAKAAGVSIDDVQALLKKGGESAAADLDILLKAAEQKFGEFAQVPLSIGEQWTVLQNKIATVFQGLGEAILPVISQIVDLIGNTLIPALKTAVDEFNALPQPVKDAAVAFGLIVSAAAPLAVAVGGFGLALIGIQTALPVVTGLLGTLGITATTTATEVVAAEQAIGSGGLAGAASAATTALGGAGLAGALGSIGLALATFGGAAAVTVADINTLKGKWDEFVVDSNKEQVFQWINAGVTASQLKTAGVSVDQLKTSVVGMNKEIDYSNQTLDTFGNVVLSAGNKAHQAATGFDDFGIKVKIVSDGLPGLSSAAQAVIEKQNQLTVAVNDARATWLELKAAEDGITVTHADVERAYTILQSALKALDGGTKDHVATVASLTAEMTKNQASATAAQTVLDSIRKQFESNTVSVNLLAEAHKQLDSIIQKGNGGIQTASQLEQGLADKESILTQQAKNWVQEYMNVVKEYEKDDPIIQTSLDNAVKAMNAAGLSLDDIGIKSGQMAIQVLQGGKDVTKSAGDMATQLQNVAKAAAGIGPGIEVLNGHKQTFVDLGTAAQTAATHITSIGTAVTQASGTWSVLSASASKLPAVIEAGDGSMKVLLGDTQSQATAFQKFIDQANASKGALDPLISDTNAETTAMQSWPTAAAAFQTAGTAAFSAVGTSAQAAFRTATTGATTAQAAVTAIGTDATAAATQVSAIGTAATGIGSAITAADGPAKTLLGDIQAQSTAMKGFIDQANANKDVFKSWISDADAQTKAISAWQDAGTQALAGIGTAATGTFSIIDAGIAKSQGGFTVLSGSAGQMAAQFDKLKPPLDQLDEDLAQGDDIITRATSSTDHWRGSITTLVGSVNAVKAGLDSANQSHQQLNDTASKLPSICDQSVQAMRNLGMVVTQDISTVQGLAAAMQSVAAATQAAADSFAAFDAAAQAGQEASGGKLGTLQGRFYGEQVGGGNLGGGGLELLPLAPNDPNMPANFPGGPAAWQLLQIMAQGGSAWAQQQIQQATGGKTSGSSTPSAPAPAASAPTTPPTTAPTGPAVDPTQIASINAQIQQLFDVEKGIGAVDLSSLQQLASSVGEIVKVDAFGDLSISVQAATTALQSTATAVLPLATSTTAAATALSSFAAAAATPTPSLTTLASTVQAVTPQLSSFSAAVQTATDLTQSQNTATASLNQTVNSATQALTSFSYQPPSHAVANYVDTTALNTNPNLTFDQIHNPLMYPATPNLPPETFIPPTMPYTPTTDFTPGGLATSQLGSGTTININNPNIANQATADYLVNQLRNLGVR